MSYNKSNPFAWDNEPLVVDKEVSDDFTFNTIPTQRNASYTEVAEETFTDTEKDTFFGNNDAPTPQLRKICGIECPDKN